jgi:hypothetical protein
VLLELAWLSPCHERRGPAVGDAWAFTASACGTLVGVFRSVIVPAGGTSAANWRERRFRYVAVFWAASRASNSLPVPLYVWCHDQSTMVRREFNSQFRRGCRRIGRHPDDDDSRVTFRRKLRHFAIQKGNWGAVMEVAGLRFALDLSGEATGGLDRLRFSVN